MNDNLYIQYEALRFVKLNTLEQLFSFEYVQINMPNVKWFLAGLILMTAMMFRIDLLKDALSHVLQTYYL